MTSNCYTGVRHGSDPMHPTPIEVINPATGAAIATVLGGGRPDAEVAADLAARGLQVWRSVSATERAAALRRIADRIEAAVDGDLPALITAETGKRWQESRAEVAFSASYFRWYAALAEGDTEQTHHLRPDLEHRVLDQPIGVVAVLTPWNFPLSIPARKIAPALAAGCSVLFKPSEVAPLSGLRLAEIIEAEIPAGALGTVAGDAAQITRAWIDDPQVRAVSFTGSTRVGRIIAARCATHFTRTVLELGGKASFIVLPDGPVSDAVACLMVAKYRNNGQSCIAADTVWVPDSIADGFVDQFADASRRLVAGDPMDDATTLGPTALPDDPVRLRSLAQDAARNGSRVVRPLPRVPEQGYFCEPLICLDPPDTSAIATEEIFGPVVAVRRYTDVAEVVSATNAGRMGLAAYVVGSDVDEASRVARKLDVGIVGVNTGTPNSPEVPFGGRKDSGLGYEGGAPGLTEFLGHQTITVSTAQ